MQQYFLLGGPWHGAKVELRDSELVYRPVDGGPGYMRRSWTKEHGGLPAVLFCETLVDADAYDLWTRVLVDLTNGTRPDPVRIDWISPVVENSSIAARQLASYLTATVVRTTNSGEGPKIERIVVVPENGGFAIQSWGDPEESVAIGIRIISSAKSDGWRNQAVD